MVIIHKTLIIWENIDCNLYLYILVKCVSFIIINVFFFLFVFVGSLTEQRHVLLSDPPCFFGTIPPNLHHMCQILSSNKTSKSKIEKYLKKLLKVHHVQDYVPHYCTPCTPCTPCTLFWGTLPNSFLDFSGYY